MSDLLRQPRSNACHFCKKVYSASMEDIYEAGKLFEVDDFLVGRSWWTNITICSRCLKREGEKIKKRIDAAIAEAEKRQTTKRIERYYPPKKVPKKSCPDCKVPLDKEGFCEYCGDRFVDRIEDPRQIKKRKKRLKASKKR
jgi:hypothetical protein